MPPYGFKNGKTEDKKPTLLVNNNEIEIVKYCFKSKRENGGWDNVTIVRMLQNSVYAVADERLKKYYEIRKIKFLNDCV